MKLVAFIDLLRHIIWNYSTFLVKKKCKTASARATWLKGVILKLVTILSAQCSLCLKSSHNLSLSYVIIHISMGYILFFYCKNSSSMWK